MEPEPPPESVAEFVPPVAAPVATAPQPPALNFHNLVAVRIAFVVAPLAVLLSAFPGLSVPFGGFPALSVLLWIAAGYLAVFFHRRRTGVLLNIRAGVRLGWITGVMMFAVTAVFFTLTIIGSGANGGIAILRQQMASQLQSRNPTDPNVQEALRMLESAPGLAAILLVMLFMMFVFITILSMAGGALGAKVERRNQ